MLGVRGSAKLLPSLGNGRNPPFCRSGEGAFGLRGGFGAGGFGLFPTRLKVDFALPKPRLKVAARFTKTLLKVAAGGADAH